MDNTFIKIQEQIPEFAREQFPRFVEFLEEYYKFLGSYNVSAEHCRDADTTSKDLYSFIRREIASKFPAAMINDVKLAGTIRNLFKSKGTLNAIELLFRIFFNESVIIKQPGKNILRASDGRWKLERSILVESLYGEIDKTRQIILTVENDLGRFYVEVIRIEEPEVGHYKFYFRPTNLLEIEEDQLVDIYTNGKLTYQGRMLLSPSYLRVITPGKYWRVGQVFRVPGSTKDTIARVSSVTDDGGIGTTEIFEYGNTHSENQLSFISPFPQKPVEEAYTIETSIVGYNDIEERPIFNYTLALNDSTQMTTDSTVGVSDTQNELSYYLDDYNELSVDPRYNGTTVLTQATNFVSPPDIFVETNVTQEQYTESVALLEYKFEYIINHRGEFVTDDGMLSNDNIRMQDNFFYQAFSYVVETQRNVHEYRNVLSMIHPAGLKFFGELAKTTFILFEQGAISYVSINIRYVSDDIFVDEWFRWTMEKPGEEDAVVVEDHLVYDMVKPLEHSITTDDDWYKEVDLNKFNEIITDDFFRYEGVKPLEHSVITDDVLLYEWTKHLYETSIITDAMIYQAKKSLDTGTEPVTDSIIKDLIIEKFNSITTADGITTKEFGKNLTHSISTTDSKLFEILKEVTHSVITNDETYHIDFEKWIETSVTTDDDESLAVTKPLSSSAETNDEITSISIMKLLGVTVEHSVTTDDDESLAVTKPLSSSAETNDETYYINIEKWFDTIASVDDGEFNTEQDLLIFAYNEEEYAVETYVRTDKTITIT